MRNKNFIITTTLMITIIVDVMGMGLVFPVMPALFFNVDHALVSADMSEHWRHFYFGVAMAAWPLGMLIGSPYLGDLSDKLGRKKVIIICLSGVLITNILAGFAVNAELLAVFIFVRFLSGFFSGSFPIAQAMMVDISDASNKAKNISLVTLAASSGFIVGPLITSASTLPAVQSIFNYSVPFYIAGLVSLLNLISVIIFLPRTRAARPDIKVPLLKGLLVIGEVLSDARIKKLLIAFVLMFLGWGFYCMNLALLMENAFHYSTSMIALLFAFTALSNVLGILFLQPIMLRNFSLKKICLIFSLVLVVLLLLSANSTWAGMQWIVGIIMPGIQMVFYTAIMTLFSNAVSADEQGKVMGGADAGAALAWMTNSFAVGVLTDFSILLPLFIGAFCMLCSSVFFTRFVKLNQN